MSDSVAEPAWDPFDQVKGDVSFAEGRRHLREGYGVVPFPSGRASERAHGIPALRFTDGPRGVVVPGATCFPVSMARGATWDVGLEERIGEAMGVESRSVGANLNAGVCINVLRHPGWGRAQETYGEDPKHLGAMGSALVRGLQRHVMACVKHFACNSVENTRFWVDVQIDERTLREVYLPHFRVCVRAGAASVMSAYNRVNGRFCGGHRLLLQTILRDEWGFDGFVLSDFFLGAHSPRDIARGLDVEMPFGLHFGRRLRRAVRAGRVERAAVEAAAARVVATKRRFADIGDEAQYGAHALSCPAHRALARECAHKAMVLLANAPVDGSPVLPLDAGGRGTVALIGRLADLPNTGDRGSSRVRSGSVVTARQGLVEVLGEERVRFHDGRDLFAAAAHAATCATAVLVVGLTHRDEGEAMIGPWGPGGDRDRLRLRAHDEALIQEVVARNPRTVVVLVAGSALVIEAWRAEVPAILMSWYAGMEGGRALADLLTGAVVPSGKLPCVFPRHRDHLPAFDPRARAVRYGYLHGYRHLAAEGHAPAYPFGFGLSYTRFTYADLQVSARAMPVDGAVRVSVSVCNVGTRDADEVVQLYVSALDSAVSPRAPSDLRGFARIRLAAGARQRVSIELAAQDLAIWQEGPGWWVEPSRYQVAVGPSSDPAGQVSTVVQVVAPG